MTSVANGESTTAGTLHDLPSAPRLFIDAAELSETRAAIAVDGSHHQRVYEAIKTRVDQNDWRVYDENPDDDNWNYARAWLAREASFLYLITGNTVYAQTAFDALYAIHDDPDPDNRLPETGYGLARAATGMGFALAYDWAASGWTPTQQDYVRQKILTSLDAWPSYSHPNFADPYGSNWVAVSRGAELVMMLSVGEETTRASRFNDLKFWLQEHIEIAYGETGLTQEGQGYLAYAGGFLMPAVYALRSIGDPELESAFTAVSFEQLPLYTGVFDAEQRSLQFGVGSVGFDPEGWSSFLLDSASAELQPYYQYFYDHYRGLANPAPDSQKFDHRRAGSVWSLLHYPTETMALDPTGVLPSAIQDSIKGSYFFRNRWQDANDVLISLMGDFTHHRRSWDRPEAFALGLHAYDTHYFGGPTREHEAWAYSRLLVDGQAGDNSDTGAPDFFQASAQGGYAIVDGGSVYSNLGVDVAKRHLQVDFSGHVGTALLSTLDRLSDLQTHLYTWQANLGTVADDGGIIATAGQEGGLQTFLLTGNSGSYLKGWILNPSNVTVRAGDPLQIETTGSTTDIWVVMVVGTGTPPTVNDPGNSITGVGLDSELHLGNARIYFDAELNQIVTEMVANPLLRIAGTVGEDTLQGNAGSNLLVGFAGADQLIGESGFDQFLYNVPTEGGDTIADFSVDDSFLISVAGFGSGLVPGTSLAEEASGGQFVLGNTPVDNSPHFFYAEGVLMFDPDGTGAAGAMTLATLTGSPTLNPEQIQLIADVEVPPLVDGQVATIYVDSTNTVVGNAFQVGQAYTGALFSDTDAQFGTGKAPDDVIVSTAGADNIWAGLEGDDLIKTLDGNDVVGLGLGNVTVEAGSGDDFVYSLESGGGTNIVDLGTGLDNFWAEGGDHHIIGTGHNMIGLGMGDDTVDTDAGNDFIYTVNGGGGTNILNLGDGTNIIYVENGNYAITTGFGDDSINLGTGTDTVNAGHGDNIIYMVDPNGSSDGTKDILTGTGDDFVQTGSGNDLIDAGTGLNTLLGGAGADTFVIRRGAYNFVGDFQPGIDQIKLNDVSFDELSFLPGTGAVAADAFIFAGDEGIAHVANMTVSELDNIAHFV